MSQTLRSSEKEDFDLVIHGSPEHVSLDVLKVSVAWQCLTGEHQD